MKILLLNGGPQPKGNTVAVLDEIEAMLATEGLEIGWVQVGNRTIRGYVVCGKCAELGRCVFDDLISELAPKPEVCDGLVAGSSARRTLANAALTVLLTRLLYSTPFDKTVKTRAAVAAARRGGLSSTSDELNKFFTISGMPVVSSQYWNSIHSRLSDRAVQDAEGLQIMCILAQNMAFLAKSIALGQEKYGLPGREESLCTHSTR